VRNGVDVRGHSAQVVYKEMLLQVARDYPGLPDPRSMTLTEIVFFYSGVRPELRKHTAAKPPPKPTPRKPRKHGKR
jgi:hypothetical protein